jgi:4-amino-4-deoxy-L-arabinose transferase-like glycosyltransferase
MRTKSRRTVKLKPQGRNRNRPGFVDPPLVSPEFEDVSPSVPLPSELHSYLLLVSATVICLLPFSGRAFHIDDTLFIRAAQQIAKHPLDPYGFQINWDGVLTSMSEVTQNPPLSSYYAALVASLFGWSERALHCGFLVVAIALVLGTYRLAMRFTRAPMLAALVTLLCPGVLVSASSVMCDTMMLALWLWAVILWMEGIERNRAVFLALSSLLIAACALTKYFGVSLIPLLLVYTLMRRRLRAALWLLVPVAILAGYQQWTAGLYSHGLLFGTADFAATQRAATSGSPLAVGIVGLSFAGGCALFGLLYAPLLWSRKSIAVAALLSAIASASIVYGGLSLGLRIGGPEAERSHVLTGIELALFIAGGVSLLALAIRSIWKERLAGPVLLSLWVLGTFLFAAFVNYTVNARSVYPLIPAAAVLLIRRLDDANILSEGRTRSAVAILMVISGAFSIWVAAGDAALANSARQAAALSVSKANGATVWFEGHWGFQYYMEALGARELDFSNLELKPGDFVVIPSNNIQIRSVPPQIVAGRDTFEVPLNDWVTTVSWQLGAGFYASYWGPIPFAVGRVPRESYMIFRIRETKP